MESPQWLHLQRRERQCNQRNEDSVGEEEKGVPKTYVECLEVLGISLYDVEIDLPQPYQQKMFNLFKLLICRDAYWKIAGEEMGLGKPWEPDWKVYDKKYVIGIHEDMIYQDTETRNNKILAFPTEEMRDAFYEAFKETIEKCKELLQYARIYRYNISYDNMCFSYFFGDIA